MRAISIASPRETVKRNSAARVTDVTPGSRIFSRQRETDAMEKLWKSARSVARNTCNGDKKKKKRKRGQPLEGKSGEEGDRGRPAVTNHSSSRTPQVPVSFLNTG